MKEKVLQVIKNSQKSIDAIKIMRTIKDDYSREELEEVIYNLEEVINENVFPAYSDEENTIRKALNELKFKAEEME